MQNPKNCTGIRYVEVSMGGGGGFASQFQMAASLWMRAAAVSEYKVPVLTVGPLSRYSETPETHRSARTPRATGPASSSR